MTITTLDLALAGMQPPKFFDKSVTPTLVAGRPHSLWYLAGIPGPGAPNTSTAGGVARSSTSALVNGQIPHYDPGAGNAYLARFTAFATQIGIIELVDRLWDCGANSGGSALSPTLTSSQTINSAAWPARDEDGSTDGKGVRIGLEVSTSLGAGTPTFTLTYTNSEGTAGRTATNIQSVAASSAIGAFYEFGLQAGDVGVRSVQSIQASATQTGGQWNLVAYRVLAAAEITGAQVGASLDLLTGGFPRLFNGTAPSLLFVPNTTTAALMSGTYLETHG